MPDYKLEIRKLQQVLYDNAIAYDKMNHSDIEAQHKQALKDKAYENSKPLIMKLAMLEQADRNNSNESLEEIDNKVQAIMKTDIPVFVVGRMDRDKVARVFGSINPNDPEAANKDDLENYKIGINNAIAWVEETKLKQKYYDEYENEFESYPVEKKASLKGNELRLDRTRFVEEKFAKAEFAKFNNELPEEKRLKGEDYTKYENDFLEVWTMNQAVKEIDYKNGLSTKEIFDMALTASGNVALGQERVDMLNAWSAKTIQNKAYGTVPTDKSGAIARSYYFLYNFDGTEDAEIENQTMVDNLNSDDPEVHAAEYKRLCTKYINKVLAIPDELFMPKTDEEAAKILEDHYPEMYLAFEVQHFLEGLKGEYQIPDEIREALNHKTALYQENISKYLEKFPEQANPEQAKVNFIRKVGAETIVKSMSGGYPHSFRAEEQPKIMASVTASLKEEVFGQNAEPTKSNPEKYDGLAFDGNFVPELSADVKNKRKALVNTIMQGLKGKNLISPTAEVKLFDKNHQAFEHRDAVSFSEDDKCTVEVFEPGEPVGKVIPVSMDKNNKVVFEKAKVVSQVRDLTYIAQTPKQMTAELEKLQKLIKATDPFYVWSNSDEFANVRDSIGAVIKAQKAMGDNPNMKQIREYNTVKQKFENMCDKYLEVKADKLKDKTDDERGQMRYNIIKSMKSILSGEHTNKYMLSYPAFKSYANSYSKVTNFRSKAENLQNDVFKGRVEGDEFNNNLKELVDLTKSLYSNLTAVTQENKTADLVALSKMALPVSNILDAARNKTLKENLFTDQDLTELQTIKKVCQQANMKVAEDIKDAPGLMEAIQKYEERQKAGPAKAQEKPQIEQGGPGLK